MNRPFATTAFEPLRRHPIASLNLVVEHYRHPATGAEHYHLACDSDENVFLVALRTVPQDSTGVAHILEHTVLCGSERYPVRDPFFLMIRRSLNTFMNALTSADWTAYPFASRNRKDFFNLLDVYLDAVFFPLLDPLDFAQEGHRLEFAEPDNPDSPLVRKGVVYNEMKGAMSSVTAQLWQALGRYLWPTTTYHYNSGGDPACIPDLTHEALVAFHRLHYHPGNAVFLSYGDIPAGDIQARLAERVLGRFGRPERRIAVPDEKRYLAPVRVEEAYPFDEEGDPAHHGHVVLGWLLGHSADPLEAMEARLLTGVLLDNSASPLLHALETTELGSAPSPLCGLDDSQRELCFVCGLEGTDPEKAEAVERLVLGVLEEVAERGVDREQVEACLHQLELEQREITGGTYPYGLELLLSALPAALHGGDPVAALDIDPTLEQLRRNAADPDYIKRLTRRLLLDNQHRVRLTLRPDPELSARRLKAERAELERLRAALGEEEARALVDLAASLRERQARKQDVSVLPKVGLEDVPRTFHYVSCARRLDRPAPIAVYQAGTNGLVYQQVIHRLPALEPGEWEWLPIYAAVLTEVGVGERDYLATQRWQAAVCGAIHAYAEARGHALDAAELRGHLTLSAKGLGRNQIPLTELMLQTLAAVRFDELERLRDLVAQMRARADKGIPGSGHLLAMGAAARRFSPGAAAAFRLGGLGAIARLRALDAELAEPEPREQLAERLAAFHRRIAAAPRQYLLVAEGDRLEAFTAALAERVPATPDSPPTPLAPPAADGAEGEFWKVPAQVNYCARVYPTVPLGHPDAPALSVLAHFLRNGFLHTAVREQGGAYGGGASQDNQHATFRFYSYRDPRLAETLADFDRALAWLAEANHDFAALEEAILGVIAAVDKPSSPAGEAKKTFHAELYGATSEVRENFRRAVLDVTLDDLRRVAERYLRPERAATAVLGPAERAAEAEDLGLAVQTL
ncbi:MAG: peptidase M16 [Porticoccaceae bacterium]|nr:MAG: peptidase M16 [Porticoccaceae bacterium]